MSSLPNVDELESLTRTKIMNTISILRTSYKMLDASSPYSAREIRSHAITIKTTLDSLEVWQKELSIPCESSARIERLRRFCAFCTTLSV